LNTNFYSLTIELLVGFIALLLLTKVLGKTQITQLTPFDFISALILGELVGNAIYDKQIGINYVLYAVMLWGLLITLVEKVTQKWKRSRSLLEGKPAIIIRNGMIDREELKKNNLDLHQLQNLLRNKDIFTFNDVAYAILEANGTVNVLKKSLQQATTREDLSLSPTRVTLPMTLISDGEWIVDNVSQAGMTIDELSNKLTKGGIDVTHVLVAEWDEGKPLYLQLNRAPFIKTITLN
jgi:uncharacterized membrane protein YcaP (DUF421 family)